jgi:hypothetical protein
MLPGNLDLLPTPVLKLGAAEKLKFVQLFIARTFTVSEHLLFVVALLE